MYLNFKCSECSSRVAVCLKKAASLWREDYEKCSSEEKRNKHFNLFVVGRCLCGKETTFRGKLFQHMFEILFNTLVLKGKSKIN